MTRTLPWAAGETARPLSATLLYLAAAVLQTASGVLARVAAKLAQAERAEPAPHVVEFHPIYRDSGAPEGALYVDGKLVGIVEGVTRL
ncbi:MAG TPA: hypothetical protein VHA82_15770 [Ramlibacter sp.]|uniref:hypothetical protein n=1 Tax=Ramlibacter sp. TaxID=1917967 RepID=UPI002B58057F|nr:hypothetical protein [Ramlibacter sp.]HVZ45268.1 hypothetical protein [Ramlibacter sp.]